jgi:hypothetical protein
VRESVLREDRLVLHVHVPIAVSISLKRVTAQPNQLDALAGAEVSGVLLSMGLFQCQNAQTARNAAWSGQNVPSRGFARADSCR